MSDKTTDVGALVAENDALRRRVAELEASDQKLRAMLQTNPDACRCARFDLTEHKEAEKALRLGEERFRSMVETTTEWIWELDLTGKHTFSNPAVLDILGFRPEELVGQGLELLHPEDRPDVETRLPRLIEEKRGWRGWVLRWRHKDGTYRYLESNAVPLINTAGDLVGYLGTDRNITDRILAEEAVRRSEAVLAQAGKMASLGAWWIDYSNLDDLNANALHWSPEVFRIFGYLPGEVEVTIALFFERVHPDDRSRIEEAMARAIAARMPYSLEHRVLRPDGTERVVWEHAEGIFDDAGRPRRMIGAVQDITERKHIEEALHEADRRKTEFLATLSHELRNPLAPIRNSLFILDRVAPGGEQARRAQAVLDRQVAHMTRLVDDLLDVSRITRGSVQLQRERLDLNDLVTRTIEDQRSEFAKSGVRLETSPAPGEVWLCGDRTRLTQVVGNLLQNAAKFTPRGGSAVISLFADVSRAQAVLTVRDTGSGIAPEMMPRVFEAFAQADRTLDRSKGGLGLGLAIVKGLVEMHGGSVSAASDGIGKGAVFTIRLPLETTSAARTGDLRAHGAGSPRRILVIEDNVDAADSLREALQLGGHSVVVAYDGPSGIERARALRPDVVLCDIGLPGMDGHVVARAMRADPELGRATLVALSGYAQPEDVARAMEAGFDAHLAKPPNMEALERVLEQGADLCR